MVLNFAVCVPTLNAGPQWQHWLEVTLAGLEPTMRLVVIDSSSDDDTATLARNAGAEVISIDRQTFNHGGTRNRLLHELGNCDVVIFMTQDAFISDPAALTTLGQSFDAADVGAAFGRQLAHRDATPIAAHARLFNYPANSRVVSQADIPSLGIKTAFLSNSFAAYRRQALIDAGGFPNHVILSEDMMAGARLLKRGWKLAYNAQACVYHSHNYSVREEFKRYFDIGAFHAQEAWLIEWLGSAEGEGLRFIRSETSYLLKHAPFALPSALLRAFAKYAGYRLGRCEKQLPTHIKKRLSMHAQFWS